MDFRLQQNLMTLNDHERQFTALSSVLCVLLQTAEARIMQFKVNFSPMPYLFAAKFYYKIRMGSP